MKSEKKTDFSPSGDWYFDEKEQYVKKGDFEFFIGDTEVLLTGFPKEKSLMLCIKPYFKGEKYEGLGYVFDHDDIDELVKAILSIKDFFDDKKSPKKMVSDHLN